ncbi:MAG: hypothetical protein WD043_12450 [Gemmatimonadales bacterium]
MKLASLEALTRALNAANVPFLVAEGLAVNVHGYGRHTHDVDLVVRLDAEVIRETFSALASLGYRPRVAVTAEGFADAAQRQRWIEDKGMTVLSFHSDQHRETPVDIFVEEPFDFREEYDRALVEEIAPGVPMRIVRLETLLALKARAGRAQDLADISELHRITEQDRP